MNRTRASALIIVLAAVVIVSALVLTFYVQVSLNRQTSFSSGGYYRADQVARSGLDTLIGDLQSEMVRGSMVSTNNNVAIYAPTNNFTAMPFRVADQGIVNLVKKSAGGSNAWSGTNYIADGPIRSATGNSSTNNSVNGRRIDQNSWNSHYLFGTNLPGGFIAPDWVIVTRAGAVTNTMAMPALSALADPSVTNAQYAVGRFAYAIFNEGGLLDINVAGYPTGVSADFTARRGLLPQVNLGKIPGVADANAIVSWRNAVSAASATAYTNAVFSNTNGFTRVVPGDQTFISRKDLIKYAEDHSSQISLSALQYLGTFSRELSAPSYTPDPNRPTVGGLDNQFNPALANLRRADGQPLIQKRFPLSRLALLTPTATADSSSDIYKYFGLQRASISDPWVYSHAAADRILRLSEVAAAGRDPDFFELLQAAITFGSLGKNLNNLFAATANIDQIIYCQVLQIGANIIDQYDADSYPTRISLTPGAVEVLSGVENLPYLNRVFATTYRLHGAGQPTTPKFPNLGMWLQPEIWNPHAQAGTLPPAANSPTTFRFIAEGVLDAKFIASSSTGVAVPAASNIQIQKTYPSPAPATGGIQFSNSSIFQNTTLLDPSNATATGSDDVVDGATHFVGLNIATATAVDYRLNPTYYPPQTPLKFQSSQARADPLVSLLLQYMDQNGTWVTYSRMRYLGLFPTTAENTAVPNDAFQTYDQKSSANLSDPRTERFGAFFSHSNLSEQPNPPGLPYLKNFSLRPDQNRGFCGVLNPATNPGWFFSGQQVDPNGRLSVYLGTLSDNKGSSETHYTDPDGIQRRGDGAYTDGTLADGGYPLATDAFNPGNSRPVILNRPFRSVGELAYASRGMPWKTLDFFTAESADAALLDIFCLHESPDPAVESGKIDLNTRQQPVLQAVLSGAIQSDQANTTISDSDAATLAASLIARTTNTTATKGPLLNRADLVTKWAPDLAYTSSRDTIIKPRREAAIRALADVGMTRTWNLLIDLVAQSGRYAKNASNLDQFVVEGQRRYWLHVALDRYTGKIVAQSLELINE